MSDGNRKFSRDFGQDAAERRSPPVDFGFLATQTFGDATLEREVLELFVAQARRLLPTFATLDASHQADTAHLLKGSARGIGAWAVAAAAERYEAAGPSQRSAGLPALQDAVAAAERAIRTHLDTAVT